MRIYKAEHEYQFEAATYKELLNFKPTDYQELLSLTSVRQEIEADILHLELSGTYFKTKDYMLFKTELSLINVRLEVFNN